MATYKNVFLIDDDDLFLFLTKTIMEDENFAEEIQSFQVATKALNYLKSCEEDRIPDIIFLDINMPVMDGWEFMDLLEEANLAGKMNIYITSSSINPMDLEKAENNPFIKAFIDKPLDLEKFEQLAKTSSK
jgi:CheY-like chemotaxis protein